MGLRYVVLTSVNRDDLEDGGAALEVVALPHLERGVERPRPPGVVVVVGLGAPELVEVLQAELGRGRHAVEEPPLVERAVRAAFAAGAVVRDHDDDRVLELLGVLEVVDEATDLRVAVGDEAREHLGHPREQAPDRRKARERRDLEPLEILRGVFPDREIIGLPALDLVWGFGVFHCLSQQEPA